MSMINDLSRLQSIAERIKKLETNREKLGAFLREIKRDANISGGDVLEEKISYPVKEFDERIKICATDGGSSQNSYHGLDIILVRAVSVIAEYNHGKLENILYFPDAFPEPEIEIVSDPFTDEEFLMKSSLIRQKKEILTTIEAVKEHSPEVVLMDGSIVPHPSSRPQKNSVIYKNYLEVIEALKELYSLPLVAGCSEDSRGRKFCDIVSRKILSVIDSPLIPELKKILAGTRDTNLLYHVLDVGERTCVFRYGDSPVIKDLGKYGENIYTFYLKPAEFDRPLRIDFYAEKEPVKTAEKIASIVHMLCCHSSYAYPAPLVEADLRAKLKEIDIELVHRHLVDITGLLPSLMKLRRENRPFR